MLFKYTSYVVALLVITFNNYSKIFVHVIVSGSQSPIVHNVSWLAAWFFPPRLPVFSIFVPSSLSLIWRILAVHLKSPGQFRMSRVILTDWTEQTHRWTTYYSFKFDWFVCLFVIQRGVNEVKRTVHATVQTAFLWFAVDSPPKKVE